MAKRRPLLLLSVPLLLVLATACGGNDAGAVRVDWQARDGGPVRLQMASNDAYQTSVTVHNGTSDTLRDARLRLRPQAVVQGIEVGGTVTNTRTEIDGADSLWRLGDLAPGEMRDFPLGLWFDVSPQVRSSNGLDLIIELMSPDLHQPLVSSPLRVEPN